ncbi:hypothetical protein Hbal_2207 [Hirschia baltica ATCC 49814]|uniref:Flagellar hook-length control protein-like C-terminal domain-containing protein n=2 Tax=Hirschia TaxID=2723 RepID=C6XM55_HIRBI|nr:hypothetical protein Hbal_2207 [Hirschia baltica ATCC 49814]
MIEGVFFSAQKTNNSSTQRADGALIANKFNASKNDFRSFLQGETEKQSMQTENKAFNQHLLVTKSANTNLSETSAEQSPSNETADAAAASALITLNMVPTENTQGNAEMQANTSPVINANSNAQANVENAQVITNKSTPVDVQTTVPTQNASTGVTVSDANASTSSTITPANMGESNSGISKPVQIPAQSAAQQTTEILKNAAVKQEDTPSSPATAKTPAEAQTQPHTSKQSPQPLSQTLVQSQTQLSQQAQTSQSAQPSKQLPMDNGVANQATPQTQILSASNGQAVTAAATTLTAQSNKTSNASSTAAKIENANSSSTTTSNASAAEMTSEPNKASSNTSAQTPAATRASTTATNTSSAPTPAQPPNVQELLSGLPDAELLEGLEPSSEETNLSSTTSNSATGKTQELPPTLRHASSVTQQAWAGLIQRMDGKSHQFQIRLDPAALGQINVSIEITKDKRATVVLAAKSAEALSELSRGSKALESALADVGIDLAEDGLKLELSPDENSSFTFKDDDAEQMADDKGEASISNSSATEENADLPRQITPKLTAWSRARVDLTA